MKPDYQLFENGRESSDGQLREGVDNLSQEGLETGLIGPEGTVEPEAVGSEVEANARAIEVRMRIQAVSQPDFVMPDSAVDASQPPPPQTIKPKYSLKAKVTSVVVVAAGIVGSWISFKDDDSVRAEVRQPVATTVGPIAQTPETAPPTMTRPHEATATPEVTHINRELSVVEKQKLADISGFGLTSLPHIIKTAEFDTAAGKTEIDVIPGPNGVRPVVPEAEVAKQISLFDALASQNQSHIVTVAPAGGEPITVSYEVRSADRPRVVIFANPDQDFSYPIYPVKGVDPPGFTDVAPSTKDTAGNLMVGKKGLPEVVMIKVPVDNSGAALHIMTTELAHSAWVVEIPAAEQRRLQSQDSAMGGITMAELTKMLQESESNGAGMAATSESFAQYMIRQRGNTLPIFSDVKVPYRLYDEMTYNLIQATLK